MGSFYVNCSISNKTISDGDKMVIQFMVPAKWGQFSSDRGMTEYNDMTISLFLSTVKLNGLDAALEEYNHYLSERKERNDEFLAPKGLIVSNEGSMRNWVPVGPAIKGHYDDYGRIAPSDDEENLKRIKVLESIFYGVPFNSIMEAATDDRWLRYGFREGDTDWKVEGLDKNLSDEALTFFKNLSVTYIHQSVYDEVKQFDFCAEEGKMKSKYSKKWKNEYIDGAREKLVKTLKSIKQPVSDVDDSEPIVSALLNKWKIESEFERIDTISRLTSSFKKEYINRLSSIVDDTDFEWFFETMSFTYNLHGMCIELTQSFYGSQHRNWKGWARIESALNGVLEETVRLEKEQWGDDEDEDEIE